jgi:hypothetical protein
MILLIYFLNKNSYFGIRVNIFIFEKSATKSINNYSPAASVHPTAGLSDCQLPETQLIGHSIGSAWNAIFRNKSSNFAATSVSQCE